MRTENDAAYRQAIEAGKSISEEDAPWPNVITSVAKLLGADAGCYMAWDKATTSLAEFEQRGHDNRVQREYEAYYHRMDRVAQAASIRPAGEWLSSDMVMSSQQWEREEFFVDFMKRSRIAQIFGFALVNDGTRFVALGFQSHGSNSRITQLASDAKTCVVVQQIIASFRQRWNRSKSIAEVLGAVLNPDREAVFLVSKGGRVDLISPDNNSCIDNSTELTIQTRQIRHSNPVEHRRLTETITATLNDGLSRELTLKGQWGEVFVIRVALAPSLATTGLGSRALLRIERRNIFAVPDTGALRAVFCLSNAEARVLRELVAGHDAAQCALLLNVSLATVRKQIAAVLRKTGCNRQAELMKLASLIR